jgi:sulfane dehydrogenase subunit SoxC
MVRARANPRRRGIYRWRRLLEKAQLQDPVLPKAFTRFRLPWNWSGREVILLSRCTDESGYVQPTREELIAERGRNSQYHCNAIKAWRVGADGSVAHVDA